MMFIFDSSTLILITKIELLEVFLGDIALKVLIARAVEDECCRGKASIDGLTIRKSVDEGKITVLGVRSASQVAKLQIDFSMGRGEAESIALALQEKARILGIDDRNGIQACKLLGLPFAAAIGILLRSREKGLIGHVDALDKFGALARYGRYKSSIVEDARNRLEELR
jgi:hypothetical protein